MECTSRHYKDNLKGINYENYLSYGPIDVVYTWVRPPTHPPLTHPHHPPLLRPH